MKPFEAPTPGEATVTSQQPQVIADANSALDVTAVFSLQAHTYNDARLIGEQFRLGNPVLVTLEAMPDADARQVVDFCAGLVFGLHGTMQKISQSEFLLTPPGTGSLTRPGGALPGRQRAVGQAVVHKTDSDIRARVMVDFDALSNPSQSERDALPLTEALWT